MTHDSDDIDTQAGHWFARMRAADADTDRAAFERWHNADPRHAQAYAEIEAIWAITGEATRGRSTRPTSPAPATRQRQTWPVLLAACLIALVPIVSIVWTRTRTQPLTVVTTSAGDSQRLFRLRDGSIVTLDRHSRMTVALNGGDRHVDLLEGRARFVVAHDPAHPFTVSAAGDRVTARGTIFDVTIHDGDVRVVLIDGSVDVSGASDRPPAKAVRLAPDQMLTASHGATTVVPLRKNDAAWAGARVAFRNRRLDEVAAIANRLGRTPIVMGDAHGAALRVTGVFDVQNTAALARKLAATFDLDVVWRADAIVLTTKAAASYPPTP